MAKLIIVVSTLVLSLVSMMGRRAEAYVVSNTSLTGFNCACCAVVNGVKVNICDSGVNSANDLKCQQKCSVEVDSILKGLKNVTNVEVGYEVVLILQEATVFCRNPANGSSEAKGVPFFPPVLVESVDTTQDFQILKNGRALSSIIFHDEDIIAVIIQALIDQGTDITSLCKPKWILLNDAILVKKMQVWGTLFTDRDGDLLLDPNTSIDCNVDNPRVTECKLEDALVRQCSAPANALNLFEFGYQCNTLCHDEDPAFPDCPQPPQQLPVPFNP